MSKRVLYKWAECRVMAGCKLASETIDDFDRVLSNAADERPLQSCLASFPALLGPLAPLEAPTGVLTGPGLALSLCPTSCWRP